MDQKTPQTFTPEQTFYQIEMKNSPSSLLQNKLTSNTFDSTRQPNDSDAIKTFLSRNKGKKVVVIQGLGFVGAVMSLVCANSPDEEYAVIGVDLPTTESLARIHSLNSGHFPLTASDKTIEEFFSTSKAKGNLFATADPVAYSYADVIVVDVNLDVIRIKTGEANKSDDFSVDLSHFENAIATIGKTCRAEALVIIETTVPPGTCKNVVQPILYRCLKDRGLPTDRIRLGHSYERVMPGPNYVKSIREIPRVYAGIDETSAAATHNFLRTILDVSKCSLTRLATTTASEMAKVLENSFRAVNIAFMVEWTRFAEEAGVDIYSIVEAIRQRPTHSNLMLPGLGVGGYCLTKDPLLASWARSELLGGAGSLHYSVQAVHTNELMPSHAFAYLSSFIGGLHGKRVLLLGVTYRGDVGDTRFSPVAPFYDMLILAGAHVTLHDPFVPYWREKSTAVHATLSQALAEKAEVVVFCASHTEYRDPATMRLLRECDPCLMLDTVGVLTPDYIDVLRARHQVKVLGRGDL